MSEKESSREDSPGMRKSEYEESPEGELRGQRRNLETKPTAENDLPTERSHAGNSTVMLETTGDVSEKNTSGIKVDSTVSPVDDKDWVLVNHPELVIGSQQTERNLKWRRVRVPDPRVSSAFFAIDENGEETASSATSLLVPGSGLKELKVRQEFRQFSIANATPYWDINFVRDEPAHATPGIHSQDPPELARASGQDDEMKEDEQERVSPSKPEDAAVSEMDFDEMLFQENKELTANEASSQTNISPKPKTTPPTPHFNSKCRLFILALIIKIEQYSSLHLQVGNQEANLKEHFHRHTLPLLDSQPLPRLQITQQMLLQSCLDTVLLLCPVLKKNSLGKKFLTSSILIRATDLYNRLQ